MSACGFRLFAPFFLPIHGLFLPLTRTAWSDMCWATQQFCIPAGIQGHVSEVLCPTQQDPFLRRTIQHTANGSGFWFMASDSGIDHLVLYGEHLISFLYIFFIYFAGHVECRTLQTPSRKGCCDTPLGFSSQVRSVALMQANNFCAVMFSLSNCSNFCSLDAPRFLSHSHLCDK